ncbi:hypothetical protein E2C01_001360 [Portunus trituberculatus]|uniref:Uncharacterized protein n=1 Tax=Portunus trituberculatus TaxID=210409 RepID=A0A5B7CHT3_PORTR|nr:hypothetical protein [Portunus trituberculatus]
MGGKNLCGGGKTGKCAHGEKGQRGGGDAGEEEDRQEVQYRERGDLKCTLTNIHMSSSSSMSSWLIFWRSIFSLKNTSSSKLITSSEDLSPKDVLGKVKSQSHNSVLQHPALESSIQKEAKISAGGR